jgi:hypothetical protein
MVSNGYTQVALKQQALVLMVAAPLGRTLMKTIGNELSNSPTASVIAYELTVRIRKLRWMGMEDEAKALERELKSVPTTETDSVLAAPRNTD